MATDFDWRTETASLGTVSRLGQYVRGDCAQCPQRDVLLYDRWDLDVLVCASCYRQHAVANERTELCDSCGATPAWRDPVTRRNEFFCAHCHAENGTVFQNRWAPTVRESKALGVREKIVCAAADHGTECKGEIRWRSKYKMDLCNKHAGVVKWHD